uniref:HTH gntR-type domain-containing protein n=1 Tax=Rhodococcus sp. NS1 TaxID=402236 RepID=A0A097SQQ0_9NOCA|nr:hypothetical protein LRS1606.434 [Rhodococcus sp. NS1]
MSRGHRLCAVNSGATRTATRIEGRTAGEISESIRNLVGAGELKPADPLSPIRELARELGVHRNTVAAAYRLLVAAGVAETRGRHGTFIRSLPTVHGEGGLALAGHVDLSSGNPDPDLLPDLGGALTRTSYTPPLYGTAATDAALEKWARRSMEQELGRPASITITNGAVDAVERLLTAHLTRGDAVAIEDPCFLASVDTLRVNGFKAIPMPVDVEGITLAGLRHALKRGARAVVCTPRAHNPTGANLSADRATALRSLLIDYPHVLVIEDDHFSAVSGQSYHRLAPTITTRWALVRSVSKFLGPDLRVAIVASDVDTAARLGTRLRPGANWVSHLQQRLTADLLCDPEVAAQLDTARRTYAKRREILIQALTDKEITVTRPADGLNIWIPFERDSSVIVDRLADQGWLVRDGAQFAATPSSPHNAIRVTASTITADRARRFAATLSKILAD